MTAEEILINNYNMDRDEDGNEIWYKWNALEAMKEFTEYHVEKALKAASEKALGYVYVYGTSAEENQYADIPECLKVAIQEESVLSAYPLDLIQ